MLFNSYEFIFVFFPVVISIYFLLGKIDGRKDSNFANVWLIAASLFFYGWWDIRFLPLLVGSIFVNYFIAGGILKFGSSGKTSGSKFFFGLGLLFNIGLLGLFKYADFVLETFNRLGANFNLLHLILPLGISFFTITQLLYLYDCYEGTTKDHKFSSYALFVSFFPHLLAGPILFHRQMMKQFADKNLRRPDFENLSRGLTLFIIGLSKKVLIADELSPIVQAAYSSPAELSSGAAWFAAICYMLQLYFDFSGYSDMAVGLSKMMNLEIPINFNTPYRATGMINFWQRWHISLTNAITACVYMPIIRKFKTRTTFHTITASFIAFFIVGIWHGAGWTFVIFAIINALGIVANYLWKQKKFSMPKILAHCITLFYIMITLVFFRANSVTDALTVLEKLFVFESGDFGIPRILTLAIFCAGILIVAFCPSSNDIAKKLKPSIISAAILTILFILSILHLAAITEFLYFQF